MANFKKLKFIVVLLAGTISLSGCAALEWKRDFSKIFSPYLKNAEDNPVILIPGMIGSRLVDKETGKMVWGAIRAQQVFFLSERNDVALPINKLPIGENRDTITSKGIIDKYEFPTGLIQLKVYREILDMFEDVGYKLGDIKNPRPGDTLYVFDYDWRRDNVENAQLLHERIENIKKAAGKPYQKFTLVCHSMGGLLARYYMRYGDRDVLSDGEDFESDWKGAFNLKRVILIGIPNLGSMPVFKFLHQVQYPPYVLFTLPSIYQLLPSRELSVFLDENGNDMNIDLYKMENWKKYGWSIYSEDMTSLVRSRYRFRYKDKWKERFEQFKADRDAFVQAALDRADLFHKSLAYRPHRKPPCNIILFGGDVDWTLNKALLKYDPARERWITYFWDPRLKEKILVPGDTMVTRESLLGVRTATTTSKAWEESPMPISFSLFLTQRHENIHKDATFKNNLLHILLVD